jgi:hypothetical protein
MTVKQWLEGIRRIDLFAIARDVIEETEEDLVKINRDQLMRNENSDGEFLGEYKSSAYAKMKIGRNQSGVVDLFLRGDFQRSIFVQLNGREFFMNATDSKTDKLERKYGKKILGVEKGYHYNNYRLNKFLPKFKARYDAARKSM